MADGTLGSLVGYLSIDDSGFSGGLGSAIGSLQDFGADATKNAAIIGASVGAVLGAALYAAVDFEQMTHKLEAQLGVTAKRSGELGKVAGDLYANSYGESLEDTSDAVSAVVRNIEALGDASDEQIGNAAAKALDLADAFGIDVMESTRAVSTLMKTGLAKNADEAFDIIAAGMQSNVNSADDLIDTFTEYSTIFRTLGLEGDDALGLLSQGLKGGARDADVIADSLKELLLRVQAGDANGGLRAVGLDATQMAHDISMGGDTSKNALDKIITAYNGIQDPAQKATLGVELFGTKAEDAQQALGSLDLKTAASDFEAMHGPIQGTSDRMDAALGSTRQAMIDGFMRSIQMTGASFGEALLPAVDLAVQTFKGFFEIVGGVVDFFTSMPVGIQIAIGALVALKLATTSVGLAIKAAFMSNPIGAALVGITTVLSFVVGAMGDTEDATTDLSGVIDANTGAWTENAKAALAASLEADGTAEKFREAGVPAGLLTEALMNGGEAADSLADILSGNLAKAQDADYAASYNTADGYNNVTDATNKAMEVSDLFAKKTGDITSAQEAGQAVLAESTTGFDQFAGKIDDNNVAMEGFGTAAQATIVDMTQLTSATEAAANPLTVMGGLFADTDKAASDADNSIKFFNLSVNKMLGINIPAQEATKLFNDAIRDTAKAFTDAKEATEGNIASLLDATGAIDTTTQAGSDLYDGLQDMRDGYDVATTSAYDNAIGTKGAAGALADAQYAAEQARAKFLQNAQAMGLNEQQAGLLADSLGIVEGKKITDKNFAINATDLASTTIAALDAKQIADKIFTVTTQVKATYTGPAALQGKAIDDAVAQIGRAKGGPIPGFAGGGGLLSGSAPSNPNIDNLIAMVGSHPIGLRSGEFVQPVESVGYYGPKTMEAMRTRSIPKEIFTGGYNGNGGGTTVSAPSVNIQVMIGDRDITDIVDVRLLQNTAAQARSMVGVM